MSALFLKITCSCVKNKKKTLTYTVKSYKKIFMPDLIAGMTVALILIPQSMAYAQLAGLPAYYGLYASLVPPLVAALFGSSNHLSTGPVAIVSLLTASTLEPLAVSGSAGYIEYAVLLALVLGLVQLFMGLFRLGFFVNFISHPVMYGFTNAAAIIIATSQLSKFFGVTVETYGHHYQTIIAVIRDATIHTHISTLMFGLFSVVLLILIKRTNRKFPGVLLVVIVTTVISWQTHYAQYTTAMFQDIESSNVRATIEEYNGLIYEEREFQKKLDTYGDVYDLQAIKNIDIRSKSEISQLEFNIEQNNIYQKSLLDQLTSYRLILSEKDTYVVVEDTDHIHSVWNIESPKGFIDPTAIRLLNGGNIVGAVPSGLPIFRVPQVNVDILLSLLPQVMVIALIGFTEAISVAQAISIKTKQKIDTNKELIGQGMGNIVGSFFLSYPVAGSFSRTAVNYDAGGVTKFSSVVTSIVVGITLLFFSGLLYYLPSSVLSAIIFVAVLQLIDVKHINKLWSINKGDALAALISFFVTIYMAPHMEYGLIAGILFTMVYYIYTNSYPVVEYLANAKDGTFHDVKRFKLDECTNIAVIRFSSSLFLANTKMLEHDISQSLIENDDIEHIVIVGDGIKDVDAIGIDMIFDLTQLTKEKKKNLYFASMRPSVLDSFKDTGLYRRIGAGHFFTTVNDAVTYLVHHTKHHNDMHHCPLLKYQQLMDEHIGKMSFSDHINHYFENIFKRGRIGI